MKVIYIYLFGILLICSFSNCANGQKVQEDAPVPFQQVYYSTYTGGVKGAGSGLNLYIPVSLFNDSGIALDSVYFRGRRAALQTKPQNKNLYIAYFKTSGKEKAPDLIMSSDPREEYGNRPPQIIEEIPFELEEDEAMVSFKKDGKTGYYKITGIEQKEDEVEIKYPENIHH